MNRPARSIVKQSRRITQIESTMEVCSKVMYSAKSSIIYSIFLFLAFPLVAKAMDCPECIERKKAMCAQECKLVSPVNAVRCQRDCTWQYCSHRCEDNDPALLVGSYQNCTDCLDQQFNLCDSNCATGTDRVRSMCKLGCAKTHCEPFCASKK